ncbi:unnamed protein product [Ixodes persulcatus]
MRQSCQGVVLLDANVLVVGYTSSNGYGYHVATGNCALLRERGSYLNEEPGYVCEPIEPVGSSSRIANIKMADGRPQAE